MNDGIDMRPCDLDITRRILKAHIPLHTKVWVFGSRAKGNARKFSDLDLLIDTNHQPLSLTLMAELLDDFEESNLPYKVDIVDWNTVSNNFRSIICKDKKLLIK